MLPIDDALPALRKALRARSVAVLEAPPGAGKTTRVPLALLDEPWCAGLRIVMLEPRRLAARAAAQFMSHTLGETVGGTVGYRVRGETRVSSRTRIEVVTEGVLARLLSADPALEPYACVIFDEFHERSLHADLGLALVLETQHHLRESLRVLVMSATLDGEAVAGLLHDAQGAAPVVRSEGRLFPVETRYRVPRPDERLESTTARVVREALAADTGDVLVFLPGASEQRRVAVRLHDDPAVRDARARVHVLHGSMPLSEQDAALAPSPEGTRKVVLATSIAETSLTIAGVQVVIDSGVSRLPRFEVAAGLTRLRTARVTRSSADQRRGRAGRTAPGVCYRLWDMHDDHALLPGARPEILDADLAPLALELADAGIADPLQLRWLDVPPAGSFAQARDLLAQLGALDATGRITPHGRRMASLPLQPRLAHMMLLAADCGQAAQGARLAALLEERDVLRGERGVTPADIRLRTELVQRTGVRSGSDDSSDSALHGVWVDRDGLRRVQQSASDILRRAHLAPQPTPRAAPDTSHDVSPDDSAEDAQAIRMQGRMQGRDRQGDADTGALVALAFPDRVAQRRAGAEPRYLLRNGSGAVLSRQDSLHDTPFLAVAQLDGQPPEYRIVIAAPITLAEIREAFATQITAEQRVHWDDRSRTVRATSRTLLGALVLDETPWSAPKASLVVDCLLDQLQRTPFDQWPLSESAHRLRERLHFVHVHDASFPDVSPAALLATTRDWLAPRLGHVRKWTQLEQFDWPDALLSLLSWPQRAQLDRMAPTHLEVPSGSRIALDYRDPSGPLLAVKLQEVFGWSSTPMLLEGRVAVTLQLLSPAQRPVQVTRDLAGFWRSSYFDVRKELRGRYPRHPWPEDPLTAPATRRAKPRGT